MKELYDNKHIVKNVFDEKDAVRFLHDDVDAVQMLVIENASKISKYVDPVRMVPFSMLSWVLLQCSDNDGDDGDNNGGDGDDDL